MSRERTIKPVWAKFAACLTAAVLFASALPLLRAQAAVYQGSGTKTDPYLVTNAEQLAGMSGNLSAHYKLADTIDLASYGKFTPIGNLAEKFTGSFTCDIGADGYPLYAIKNLSVSVKATPYREENKNKWEAALFGATSGATVSNIVVLNAAIENNVVGGNSGSVAYGNYQPGMGEMAAGVLIGFAYDTNVSGCIVTGTVTGACNQAGGMIGLSDGGKISNSYAAVNVSSSGLWSTGGLIGSCNSDVSGCFASGNVTGGATEPTTGGLIGNAGDMTGLITNCYSTGTVSSGYAYTNSLVGADDGKDVLQYCSNCYTTAKTTNEKKQTSVSQATGNNYILAGCGGYQENFADATADQLRAAFSGLAAWDTGGTYPTLKAVKILTDARIAAYVPGAVQTGTGSTGNSGSTGTAAENPGTAVSASSESSEQVSSAAPAVAAEEVIEQINALPAAKDIAEKDVDAVIQAMNDYDSLSDTELEKIPVELAEKLMEIYQSVQPIIMTQIVDGINALPETEKLTADDRETVLALKEKYDFLTDAAKESFSAELTEKLESAVEKVNSLETDAPVSADTDRSMTAGEIAVAVILSLLVAAAVGMDIWMTVVIIKRKKAETAALAAEGTNDGIDLMSNSK